MSDLPLPNKLKELIECGWWPSSPEEVDAQNLKPLIAKNVVVDIFPEDKKIVFYDPPFVTVAQDAKNDTGVSMVYENGSPIDPEKILIIGDFGLGSDAAIALDYTSDSDRPMVIMEEWQPTDCDSDRSSAPVWVFVATSFRKFCTALELE